QRGSRLFPHATDSKGVGLLPERVRDQPNLQKLARHVPATLERPCRLVLSAAKPNEDRGSSHTPPTRRVLGFSRSESGISPTYRNWRGMYQRRWSALVGWCRAQRSPTRVPVHPDVALLPSSAVGLSRNK